MTDALVDTGNDAQVTDPVQEQDAPVAEPVKDTAAPVDAKDGGQTLLDGDVEIPADKDVTPKWGDDWREKIAGKDDKLLSHLKRYTSLENYAKAGFEAQQKIRSGEFKKPLGTDAKPEEIAAWRKENGIPEKPDDYKFDLGGIVPAEQDKPILDGFKNLAHAQNLPPELANKVVGWYYEQQEQAVAQQQKADTEYRIEAAVDLRHEWGGEFRGNINAIGNLLDSTAPDGLKDRLLGARLADGRLLGDDPNVLRWLSQLAREQNPGAGLVPAGTADVGKGVEQRIAELQQIYVSDPDKYSREKLSAEHMQLLEAKQKMASRR